MTVISSSVMNQLSYKMAYKGPCAFICKIPNWPLVAKCAHGMVLQFSYTVYSVTVED